MSLTASLDLTGINAQLDQLAANARASARKAAQAGAQGVCAAQAPRRHGNSRLSCSELFNKHKR